MRINRRGFSLGSGALTLSFLVGGGLISLTPAEAKRQNIAFQTLDKKQASLINQLGEAIVPGAEAAGLSHYIDHQLSAPYSDNLLILRYLRVNPPFEGFYNAALSAYEAAIVIKYGKEPAALTNIEMTEFISIMMQGNPEGWSESAKAAPPAPFFYFVLRSDAIDVTYGTVEAFNRLDIPYMEHILPDHPWEVKS